MLYKERPFLASLLLTVYLLVCSTCRFGVEAAAADRKKSCVEDNLTRGKELKKLVQENNVLVSLQKDSTEDLDGAETNFKELCDRLEATPYDRVKDLEIAVVKDGTFRKKLLAKSRPAEGSYLHQARQIIGLLEKDDKDKPASYPEYVLFRQGNFDEAIRYMGDDRSTDALSGFLADQLRRKKLGNYVYSLGAFDMIAAKFVKEDAEWKKRMWAYVAWMLSKLQSFHPSSNQQGTGDLADVYVKTMFKTLEKGEDYARRQINRLEGLVDGDNAANLSALKREEMSQRIYTLKRFEEPVEFTDKEHRDFMIQTALNLGVWIVLLCVTPFLFLNADVEEDHGEQGDEDGRDDQDVNDAKDDDEGDTAEGSSSTKDD